MNGGAWVASYVLLWIAVVVMGLAVVALLRQIGVLHARLRPLGVHFAGEGPERRTSAPPLEGVDYGAAVLTLVAFTSPGCTICATLMPGLRALRSQYRDLQVHIVDHDPLTAPTFAAFNVRSTPYLVTVDQGGVVQLAGVGNSVEQIEVMVEESLSEAAG